MSAEQIKAEANRLIAAAPELLDALKNLIASFTHPQACQYDEATALSQARAAIAKAEGR